MPKLSRKIIAISIAMAIIIVAVAAYTIYTIPTPTTTPKLEKVKWTIGTGTPGSIGYIAHAAVADVVMRAYPDYFDISVQTTGGAAAAGHAAWDAGQCDLGYTALNIVFQYVTKTGRWDPSKVTAKRYDEMAIICYQYPIIYTIFVTSDLKDQITCWSDLKKLINTTIGVYGTPAGYASHEVFKAVFSQLFNCLPDDVGKLITLDVSDVSAVGDLLVTGKVKVVWGYGDSGGPASWVSDAFAKYGYKLVAVPPSTAELSLILSKVPETIKYTLDLTPFNVKTRDGRTSFETIGVPFGLVGSKQLSKDHVALFFEAHIKYAKDLEATGMSTFRDYSKWFLEFNVECFKKQSIFGAKIHPGVAEVLKKYGYDPEALGILVAK